MAFRDGDIPIVHSNGDGYPLDDLQAARFMVVIQGEARQNAWTTNMPQFSLAYDEASRLLRFEAATRDGSLTATTTLDGDGWKVASEQAPQYDMAGGYEDGWRRDVAIRLLISIGVVEPPKSRWGRLAERIGRRGT